MVAPDTWPSIHAHASRNVGRRNVDVVRRYSQPDAAHHLDRPPASTAAPSAIAATSAAGRSGGRTTRNARAIAAARASRSARYMGETRPRSDSHPPMNHGSLAGISAFIPISIQRTLQAYAV